MESERAPDLDLTTLQQAGEDRAARQARLGELFEKHRGRLLKMIHLRMDPALKARLGASDVLQEAYLEIAERLDDYLDDPKMTFFLLIRFITAQRLLKLYRFHAGAKKRDMRRELHVAPSVGPDATSIALVDHLVASGVTPSMVMAQGEMQGALLEALEGMEAIDREVLALRHFEELDNAEVARVLEIPPNTASKRYMRALERLAKVVKGGALGTS